MIHRIKLGNFEIANDRKLTIMAGPCQMESRDHALFMAESLVKICEELKVNFIYKSSFDKANRTSVAGKRGVGLEQSLAVFKEIKETFGCPILTDVHEISQCNIIAEVADVLQIPAFLCRQTDLLIAAGNTGKIINVKKGQFLAPWDMKNVAGKVESTGNKQILLTERGACFGYNTLVSDMRSLAIMAETGYPVIFDATHSVQQPGGQGNQSGGDRRFVKVLSRAATAVGVAGLFLETHEDPDNAPSDGPCMLRLDSFKEFLKEILEIDAVIKKE